MFKVVEKIKFTGWDYAKEILSEKLLSLYISGRYLPLKQRLSNFSLKISFFIVRQFFINLKFYYALFQPFMYIIMYLPII